MIERKFVQQNMKELQIQEYIEKNLGKVGHSFTKLRKTPLGEKVSIYAFRTGLIVGKGGAAIKKLTKVLKSYFNLENPQVEINEVENINLDAKIVAERIANSLERFGSNRFKGIMHKTMTDVMNSGARGVEIILSGKIPGARAKSWRVYQGYLKKCGDIAVSHVRTAKTEARLKSGIIGIQIRIMPPDIRLPDSITLKDETEAVQPTVEVKGEEKKVGEEKTEEKAEEKKEEKPKKPRKSRAKKEPKADKKEIAGDAA
ncbi:30S ribosomal protein S3 [Candidatus Woesearchaeota archaeon]|nr:30S ribosomal protein S3 [Candidatus Woesearchaeota archaeon]